MERERYLSLIVGGFVIASLALFALGVMLLSSESGIFRPTYRLRADFANVQGLIPGAPVWLAGREVGRVESVSFGASDADRPLMVMLSIDRAVQERIRQDSSARIGTIGLLGDSYIEITVGNPESPVLADGGSIEAFAPSSIADALAKGTLALDNIATLTTNLNDVIQEFDEKAGGAKAAEMLTAVSDIVLEIRQGSGLLHSLIYDQYEGGGVESIEASLAILEDILVEVKEGEGILHTLIYEPPTDQTLVMDFLEAGGRLNSILAKIDAGEGTIGMLLNDPTVYEDLKILLGGAQRSVVVRSLIRMTAEQGAEH